MFYPEDLFNLLYIDIEMVNGSESGTHVIIPHIYTDLYCGVNI